MMARGWGTNAHILLGEGSFCTVLLHKTHAQDAIDRTFRNHISNDCLSDLMAVKQGIGCRQGGGIMKVVIFLMTPSTPNVILWAAIRFAKILTSCDPPKLYAPSAQSPAARSHINGVNLEDFHCTNDLDEDIARIHWNGSHSWWWLWARLRECVQHKQ